MRLLEPLALRSGIIAPNRVLFGPHETNLGRHRSISDRHLAYYQRRMAGGTGILVAEEASVHESDWPYERAPLARNCTEGWRSIAYAAQRHGTVALAGIGHNGGQGASAYSQRELWAPSGIPEVNTREVPKVMEQADIDAVVSGFGDAARLAAASGLHGVEVNAGQHSIIRQFLSGLTNQRTDAYGADKLRFAREVLHAVRVGAGENKLVGLRLSCDELAPWAGLVPDAASEIAVALLPWIDYLVVVRGAIFSIPATRPDGHDEPGFNLGLVGQIRAAVRGASSPVPVFAQGSIVDWGQAEWALEDGRCDGVEMTRAQLADAQLVRKIESIDRGEADTIRPCILCNQTCKVRDNRNPIISCVVDPRTGHELEDTDVEIPLAGAGAGNANVGNPASPHDRLALHVLVVGAGPAGLEAARVLAGWGHRVTVWERSTKVGGMVNVAAAGSGRERLRAITAWQHSECDRLGVTIELATDATPEAVTALAPDHVIVCTGSVRGAKDHKATASAVVLDVVDVLSAAAAGDQPLEDLLPSGPIAVWDPIGGPIAVSVAELLAERGREVHLFTRDLIVGTLLSRSGDLAPANTRLQAKGVVLHKRSILRNVKKNVVVVEDVFSGEQTEWKAGALIDAGQRLPETVTFAALDAAPGIHPVPAGDNVAPRTIYEAILEARRMALAVAGHP